MIVNTFEHNTNQICLLLKETPTIIHHHSAVISPSEGPSSSLNALTKVAQDGAKLAPNWVQKVDQKWGTPSDTW